MPDSYTVESSDPHWNGREVVVRESWSRGMLLWVRVLIPSPYPHEPSCPKCWEEKKCNVCGEPGGWNICTNGRCDTCHRTHCTPGGSTSPGHGFGLTPTTRHFEECLLVNPWLANEVSGRGLRSAEGYARKYTNAPAVVGKVVRK